MLNFIVTTTMKPENGVLVEEEVQNMKRRMNHYSS
jgi:hypothetical protein